MLIPPGPIRVLVATKPVDFRKGMDGLAALVKEQLKSDPFSVVIFCFRATRADLIFWDGTGLTPTDGARRALCHYAYDNEKLGRVRRMQ